ncbi:MAG TPA: hypothetical protein VND45_11085 [Thermoanaerobaculia bacterium]|jgi:hypothetical protein|nr:hypothetical protein [Thermoanaerobaculia bacterium]
MRVIILVFTAFSLCCLPSAAQPPKRISTHHITFFVPPSFDELWSGAELVARVRVIGSRGELKPTNTRPGSTNVFTRHRLRVLELYKTRVSADCAASAPSVLQCAPAVADELVMLQNAGTVETEDEIVRVAGEEPLKPGTEYIVFLVWNGPVKAFVPNWGPNSTYEIRDGVIHPATDTRVTKEHRGKSAGQFAEELRKRGAR